MRGLLTRLQWLLMRTIGMRKIGESLDAKSDAARADLAARLDGLLTSISERESLRWEETKQQFEAIGNQLSRQGQVDTERGEANQNMITELKLNLAELQRSLGDKEITTLALGELRAEIAALRADVAREVELSRLYFFRG